MSFPPYSKYRESGVEWLGPVPQHWSVQRLKSGVRLVTEKANEKSNPIALENIESWSGKLLQTETEFQGDGIAFGIGDILFGKLRPYLAKIHVAKRKGEAVGDFHILRPTDDLCGNFIAYQLLNREVISLIDGSTFGAKMPRASWDFIGSLRFAVPSRPEQIAIAAFLDRETAKIDALVAEQQRLIELLKEKRQAVISHAVTKGLDPNAPTKDSGVDWLGEVPAHWEVVALKRVAEVQTGIAKGKDNSGLETTEIPYLRVANVQDGLIDLSEVATIDIPIELLDRYRLQPGDVLMNEGGDFDKLGRGHIWDGQIDPCIHQNHVFAVRPHSLLSSWLNLVTSSDYARFYFMSKSKQSTNLASISSTNLMELPVTVPPEQEQAQVVDFVYRHVTGFEELLRETQSVIILLQERRSALISAAVTGKIDVRGQVEVDASVAEVVAA